MPGNKIFHMKIRIASLAVLISLGAMAGCNDNANSVPGNTSTSGSAEEAKPASRRDKSSEDRGNAQFKVAGTTWIGERASARIKNDSLKISASYQTRDGDTVKRDSLGIGIKGYAGRGHTRPT